MEQEKEKGEFLEMKAIVVENSIVPKIMSIFIPVGAITIFPFIFFKGEADEDTLNHEKIHIAQYAELWVVGFLFLYAYDYIRSLIKMWHVRKDLSSAHWRLAAYHNIRFEQEAYQNENYPDYLENREKNSWKSYRL